MSLQKEVFVCLDCETTGLDVMSDRIIEVAAVRFTFGGELQVCEALVDPQYPISESALAIHHINQTMVTGKPLIREVLPQLLATIGSHIIIGHGVSFDIEFVARAAAEAKIPCGIVSNKMIDTLRLARHYGQSPSNSLEQLARHFNIEFEDSHRALADVRANIAVFKHLVSKYRSVEEVFKILSSPIKMKVMPLGKHKGRLFSEIPLEYLEWAAKANFDQDLLYSLHCEIKQRKRGGNFSQASNPFSKL